MTKGRQREIWFRSFLGSLWPCHWKGWFLIGATFTLVFPLGWLIDWTVDHGAPEWATLTLGGLFALSILVFLLTAVFHASRWP